MKLATLAKRFLRIGATGFGGPMALIGMMQSLLVEQTKEVDAEEFAEGVAIGQILPGPVAVDCATHLGYRRRGLAGAVVSTVGIVLPPFLLMLILTPLYLKYGTVPQVEGFRWGVGPAVVAVILTAAWKLGKKFIVDYGTATIAVLVLIGFLFGLHPILLVVAAGALGMVIRGRAGEGEGR